MNKAKIVSRYSVNVIDYDAEVSKVEAIYKAELDKYGVGDGVLQPILDKQDSKRTIAELQIIVKRKEIEDWKENEMKVLSEFKEFVPSDFNEELGDLESAKPYYVEKDGAVLQKWEIVKNDKTKISSRISELKAELDGSDYKVMKCYEATITSSELPYDAEELAAERQAKRDEINRLEALLETKEPESKKAK